MFDKISINVCLSGTSAAVCLCLCRGGDDTNMYLNIVILQKMLAWEEVKLLLKDTQGSEKPINWMFSGQMMYDTKVC